MRRGAAFAVLPALLAMLLAGCAAAPAQTTLRGLTMGSEWSVTIAGHLPRDAGELQRGVQERFDAVVAQMSTYEAQSDLSRFNRAPPAQWQVLPADLFTVLDYALQLARDTAGVYDPTVGALVNLWGFGPAPRRQAPPDPDAIEAARQQVGWQRVELDAGASRARHAAGVYTDLSSLAKGFAVDQVARYLDAAGAQHFLIDLSGKLRAQGANARHTPWQVAIELPGSDDPGSGAGQLTSRSVGLRDLAVASAGDYRRYFESGGRRYSHIIDPRSGSPITHGLASVTVVAPDCLRADALATVLLVLGPEGAAAYAREHDVPALFIHRLPRGGHRYEASAAFRRFEATGRLSAG